MARRMARTNPHQVIPDCVLYRRAKYPVSIDVPVAVAIEQGLPLYNWTPQGQPNSVWDALPPITVDHSGDISTLIFGGEHLWTVTKDGKSLPAVKPRGNNGKTKTSLLTATSKMMCPSLSLPAGPPSEHGTCIAAEKMLKANLQADKSQVCGQCYASEGNYKFPEPTISQMATLAWIRQECLADPSGESLAKLLVSAIEHYARVTTLKSINARLIQEIGVWSSGQSCILIPCSIPEVGRHWLQPVIDTKLHDLPWPNTRAMFENMSLQDGQVAGFFRFHDSGDINIHPKAWKAYIIAIHRVAQLLPGVVFWMPTRVWEFPSILRELKRVNRQFSLPNLIIRPSSALVDFDAPSITGLLAGTTVHAPDTEEMFADRECPAYSGKGTSCMNEDCRDCWLKTAVSVQYKSH